MVDNNRTPQDSPVTVVISRRVKPECEAEFEVFLAGVINACGHFPGYLGSSIFRPANADDPEYRVVFKFDRLSNLRHWETSEERQKFFLLAEELTEQAPEIQILTGLETWFTLPGKASIVPPLRYKMALVTWIAVFPLITVISMVLQNQLSLLPTILRVMVVTGIAVPIMTYILMPKMTQLFAKWLYPSPLITPDEQLNEESLLLVASSEPPLRIAQTLSIAEFELESRG
jgi:uncharacterized protein